MKLDKIKRISRIFADLGQRSLHTRSKTLAYSLVENKNGKALDAGCREGYYSKKLEAKGYTVIPADVVKSCDKCLIMNLNNKLPFKDKEFDLVWCTEVLQYLDNPKKVINEFERVCKKNGKIIITVPNEKMWLWRLTELFGITAKKLQNDNSIHAFEINKIKDLLKGKQYKLYGYFPYTLLKFKITRFAGFLSPSLIIEIIKA